MKTLITACATAMLLTATALADDTDRFTVAGTAPDGSTYTGTVELTELPNGGKIDGDAFTVTWKIGSETVPGVALVSKANRHILAVSYMYKGLPGVSIMTEANGKATGTYWIKGASGTGSETWTPAGK